MENEFCTMCPINDTLCFNSKCQPRKNKEGIVETGCEQAVNVFATFKEVAMFDEESAEILDREMHLAAEKYGIDYNELDRCVNEEVQARRDELDIHNL